MLSCVVSCSFSFSCVLNLVTLLHPTATVSFIIDNGTKRWNLDLIEQMFSPAELRLIQSIPLSCMNRDDALIWRGTSRGIFSVRSAYHMLKERVDVGKAECSSSGPISEVWKT
jgi:hypothetical protein